MSELAVVLILASAVLHATWNVLAKRSADPLAFLVAAGAAGTAVWALPVAVVLAREGLDPAGLPWLLASGLIHPFYGYWLAMAYEHGALSLAYPVARGTAVLLVPLLAVPLLGEDLTTVAIGGIVAIALGLLLINVVGARGQAARELRQGRRGLLFAFLTGLTITAYSLVDKQGVQHIHPLVYVWGLIAMMTLGLLPVVLRGRRAALLAVWATNRRNAVIAGTLTIGTYVIVLAALRIGGSNIGYIVPLRETSIVFATLLGVVVLRERIGAPRIAGCACIAAGVLAIALGG